MNEKVGGRWSRLVGGLLLILLGIAQVVSNNVTANWVVWMWIVVFGAATAGLAWVYLRERALWAAIVGYVAGALTVLLLVIEVINPAGAWIPSLVMLLIAAPFVYAWLQNREQWGLLVPAYVMLAVIPILLISDMPSEDTLIPAYVMIAVGLPFVVGFLRTRQLPLLIPAAIMFLIAAFFLLDAIETAAPVLNVVLALALIGGGGWLLWQSRREDAELEEPLKPKHEG